MKNKSNTHYSLGSVLNHVCLHQTVVGLKAMDEMQLAEEEPDVVIACVGGGSNFGLAFPYYHRKLEAEEQGSPARGRAQGVPDAYRRRLPLRPDRRAGMTPRCSCSRSGTTGSSGIHAGGLRYHGQSPLVSQLVHEGEAESRSLSTRSRASTQPCSSRAPSGHPAGTEESSHAIRAAIDQALEAQAAGEDRVILFENLGHGHFDLAAYAAYNAGKLEDFDFAAGATLCGDDL